MIWKGVTPAGSRGVFMTSAWRFSRSIAACRASICSSDPLGLRPAQGERPGQISSRTAFLLALWLCSSRQIGAEPEPLQAAVDDLQGRHLLGDEEDLLALLDGRGDEVRDRLRLPGARRSLDDQVPAPADLLDHDRLRAVGVGDVRPCSAGGISGSILSFSPHRAGSETNPSPSRLEGSGCRPAASAPARWTGRDPGTSDTWRRRRTRAPCHYARPPSAAGRRPPGPPRRNTPTATISSISGTSGRSMPNSPLSFAWSERFVVTSSSR